MSHILVSVAVVLCGLCACTPKGIIPRDKMSHIYADLFMVDQWFRMNQRYKDMADTMLVYEPALEKYGYTAEDYMRSMEYYMKDSERYVKMLKQSRLILEKRSAQVQSLLENQDRRRQFYDALEQKMDSLPPFVFLSSLSDTSMWIPLDSAGLTGVYADTLNNTYEFAALRKAADSLPVWPREEIL